MENDYKGKQRKSYAIMHMVYNITIGVVIIGIGLIMLLNNKIGLNLFQDFDPLMIYAFSGLCIIYGSFRLYRGVKRQY